MVARNRAADAKILCAIVSVTKPQKSFEPVNACVRRRKKSNTSDRDAAAPAPKRNVSRWQNAVPFGHDYLVEIRLLAQGAGEVLPCFGVHLNRSVVAVVRINAI